MKIRFETQDYQTAAVESVVDRFAGQPALTACIIIDSGEHSLFLAVAYRCAVHDDPLLSDVTVSVQIALCLRDQRANSLGRNA